MNYRSFYLIHSLFLPLSLPPFPLSHTLHTKSSIYILGVLLVSCPAGVGTLIISGDVRDLKTSLSNDIVMTRFRSVKNTNNTYTHTMYIHLTHMYAVHYDVFLCVKFVRGGGGGGSYKCRLWRNNILFKGQESRHFSRNRKYTC